MSEATQQGAAPPPPEKTAKPKSKPKPKAQPKAKDTDRLSREYIVYRELKIEAGVELQGVRVPAGVVVLVPIGSTTAKTTKEARRAVAKAKLSEAELKTDDGVLLRAITKSAAEVGRGIARIKVEPTWDD